MCIAVPMQVLATDGIWATCADGCDPERQERVDLRLVGAQRPGTWLLVFLGAAREVIDERRAIQTLDALAALEAVQRGEPVDHLFADLVGREPELPELLRSPRTKVLMQRRDQRQGKPTSVGPTGIADFSRLPGPPTSVGTRS